MAEDQYQDQEELFALEFSKKKKKLKKKKESTLEILDSETQPEYSYTFLLDRLYDMIDAKNIEISNIKKYKIPKLIIIKSGPKIIWVATSNTKLDIS